MSAVAALFGSGDRPVDPAQVEGLLRRMPMRGDLRETWHERRAALGVSRFDWQRTPELGGATLVARSDRTVVVADASLFYTESVRRALRSAHGAKVAAGDAARLILAAYEAWGDRTLESIEGDYAFIVWDIQAGRALVARDLLGRRSLYYRLMPGGLAVASRATALARIGATIAPLNDALVAAAVSALPGGSLESGFEGIRPAPAGTVLRWTSASGLSEAWRWHPPVFSSVPDGPLDEAALEVRRLLERAVVARASDRASAVWLSGGADSPAVFGVGASEHALGGVGEFRPVSVSYPEGDPAREDDHILAIADRWEQRVTWVSSEDVSLFDRMDERAAVRDDPFAHTFEPMNLALSRAAASTGCAIALDGHGGDALFDVSRRFLADLLLVGRWRTWWHARVDVGLQDWRSTLRWGVLPALPEGAWGFIDQFRRHPLVRNDEYPVVPWLTKRGRALVLERGWNRIDLSPAPGEGPAAFDSRCAVSGPHFSRAIALTREQSLGYGVELRSPFMDRRLIEFAASRPVEERSWKGNSKRLLKAAVKGLVPESVLAPRPFKTGVASGYLSRQYRETLRRQVERVLPRSGGKTGSWLLEQGLVDRDELYRALDYYDSTLEHLTGVSIHLTIEAELWARNNVAS